MYYVLHHASAMHTVHTLTRVMYVYHLDHVFKATMDHSLYMSSQVSLYFFLQKIVNIENLKISC